MRATTVAIALTCLLAGAPRPASAGDTATSEQGIINGEAIGTDEFPSAGQLIFTGTIALGNWELPATMPLCTATLIAPDVLLSASHCVEEFFLHYGAGTLIDPLFCVSFDEDLSWMAEPSHQGNPPLPDDAVCGSAWVQHPDWDVQEMMNFQGDGLANFHDLSLIFLDEAIEDRPFAYLPDEDEGGQLVEQMEVDIVGYGQRTPEPMDPWNPDPDAAYKRYWAHTFINELGDHEMQIGGDVSTGRKCHGDSGGPTYVDVETDLSVARRVVGVTSRAYSAAEDCNLGGVDMRIDPFLDWIDGALREACDDGTRVWCDEPGIPRPDPVEGDDDDDDDTTADDDDDDDDGGGGCECAQDAAIGRPPSFAGFAALLIAAIGLRRRPSH